MAPERNKSKKSRTSDRHRDRKMVSLPAELYERYRRIAAKNKRPVAWEIRLVLEANADAVEGPQS